LSRRRVARLLWIAWAVVVWNVVFDAIIVHAGREYLAAALVAAHRGAPYVLMDDWMAPAVTRAFWIATAASSAILLIAFLALRADTRSSINRP
jgi:hypothetical protein